MPPPVSPAPGDALAPLQSLPRGDLLLSYQQAAVSLLDTTALLLIEKSRRIGLTWGIAAAAVLTAASRKSAGGSDALYISYSQDMTREFIDACAMWARAYDIGCGAVETVEYVFRDGDADKSIQALRIRFDSGFEVMGLSSAPRALRGKQGLVIIDEAAFVDSLDELLKAAMAMMIWGGRVVVISTHNGVDNRFNTLKQEITAGQRKGKVLTITFADAIEAGLYERINLVTGGKLADKAQWIADIRAFYGEDASEELDVIPKAGSGSWLNPADIAACQHEDAGLPDLYEGGLCYGGRDVARRRDWAVELAFEEVAASLWLREEVVLRNATFREQDVEFARLMRRYRFVRWQVDQTGMGEKVVEDLQLEYGAGLIEGVLFTASAKLDLATALRTRIENHTIWLPPQPEWASDLRSVKRTKGTGETVRLADDGSSDGHADRFWAAALACSAAALPYQKYAYRPAGARSSPHGDDDDDWDGRSMSGLRGAYG